MVFNKGDIIRPKVRTHDKKKLKHPAIVWDDKITGDDDFKGIMITSSGSDKYPENVLMLPEHFDPGFYNNSHFVNQLFCKFASWGSFEKVSSLTREGLVFIEERLSNEAPLPYDTYIMRD